MSGAHLVENTESHQVIEEFMLAANEAVASYLHERDILFLRRVHGSPDERKLEHLGQFVAELGIETESLVSRFALQELLKKSSRPAGRARGELCIAAEFATSGLLAGGGWPLRTCERLLLSLHVADPPLSRI